VIPKSTRTLVWLAVSFVASGIVDVTMSDPSDTFGVSYFPHLVIIMVLSFAWCKYHSLEKGVSVASWNPLVVGLLPPIGVPIYLFRSFGFRIGSKMLAKFVAYVLLVCLLYLIPYLLLDSAHA
jgi:hypothetical protein